jgi:hypothetical protein
VALKHDDAVNIVEEASEESFPASDPPAWTPVLGAHVQPSGDELAEHLQPASGSRRRGDTPRSPGPSHGRRRHA